MVSLQRDNGKNLSDFFNGQKNPPVFFYFPYDSLV